MTRTPIRSAPGALTALLLLAGCSELFHNKRADEAHQRWSHMRASVKLQLAQKSYDNGAIDDALKQCNEVLRLDPEFTDGYLLATRIHLERGEVSKARSALDAAAARPPMTPETTYLQGVIAERQGRREEALIHYQDAYLADPDEVDYLLTYVESLIAADLCEQALEIIEPRRADFEQTPAVHTLAGQALSLLGRDTEAAECYQFAVHLAPDNPLLHEEAGIAFLAAGWNAAAVDTLMPLTRTKTDASTEERTDPHPPTSAGAIRAVTTALLRNGQPARAARVLEQAIKEHASEPTLWLMLADAHLRSGDLHSAANAARQTVTLAPEEPEALLVLAYADLQTHRDQEAIATARRILDRHPDDVEARALLALALERRPDGRVGAAEQYRRILSITPTHRWSRARLQRLDQQARAD